MADGAESGPAEQATAGGAPFAAPSVAAFAAVQRYGAVDSTNRIATAAARAGAAEGLVVVADEQTAGRGRLGRSWVAPAGSALLCSLLFRPTLPVGELHL